MRRFPVRMRWAVVVSVAVLAASCSSGSGRSESASKRDRQPPSTAAVATTTSSTSTSTSTTTTTVVPGTCPPPGPLAAPDPDRPKYTLRLALHLESNTVDGDVTVTFVPDMATDRLLFRLWPNGPRPAGAGARLTTGAVVVSGHERASSLDNPTTLVVPIALAAHTPVTVRVPWRLTLPRPVDDRISRSGDAVRLGSFFPILPWEPGVGWRTEPPTSGFAEASTSPTADFAVSADIPPGLTALATGTPDGNGRWRADRVRDFAMSIGRFRTATAVAHAPDPVQVTVGVAEGIAEDPAVYLAKEVRVLEQFAHRFGPYPWASLTMAVEPQLAGGIEYPQHVMQGPGTQGRTTSHEIGHQWFYALVGNDQGRDPWLDEGLATYAEGRFEGSLPAFVARGLPPGAKGHAGDPMTYWEARQDIYYRGVYVQGAQAVATSGDPALVDCALRRYVERNAYRIATPRDLLATLDQTFPGTTARVAAYGIRPSL